MAYGVRLASFLAARARKPSKGDAAPAKNVSLGAKLAACLSCSILSACIFTPTNAVLGQVRWSLVVYLLYCSRYTQNSPWKAGMSSTAKFGLPLLFAGLILEAEADRQNSTAEEADPTALVDSGLWSISQHPNHLGDIAFWLGNWLAGVGTSQSPGQRIAGAVQPSMVTQSVCM